MVARIKKGVVYKCENSQHTPEFFAVMALTQYWAGGKWENRVCIGWKSVNITEYDSTSPWYNKLDRWAKNGWGEAAEPNVFLESFRYVDRAYYVFGRKTEGQRPYVLVRVKTESNSVNADVVEFGGFFENGIEIPFEKATEDQIKEAMNAPDAIRYEKPPRPEKKTKKQLKEEARSAKPPKTHKMIAYRVPIDPNDPVRVLINKLVDTENGSEFAKSILEMLR